MKKIKKSARAFIFTYNGHEGVIIAKTKKQAIKVAKKSGMWWKFSHELCTPVFISKKIIK